MTDAELDPDRRAWHLAQAAVAPDEAVAQELERSAGRARRRGGAAAAAAFLERATQLTPDPARRGGRALAAAEAKKHAAAYEAASALVATAELCPLDAAQAARLQLLRAQIALGGRRGRNARPLMLDAARRLETLDVGLAREAYLEVLGAGIFAGRVAEGPWLQEAAAAARAAPPGTSPPGPIDLLVEGLASWFADGYEIAHPRLRKALEVCVEEHDARDQRWSWLAPILAPEVWDDELWEQLTAGVVGYLRSAGALSVLPLALNYRAGVHLQAGELAAASALIDEGDAIKEATGNAPIGYVSMLLAAWRGEERRVSELAAVRLDDVPLSGEGLAIGMAEFARAVLYNGLARYDDALAAAERACEHEDPGVFTWSLTELIEAGVRRGQVAVAAGAFRRLEERTRVAGTDWALGVEARSRALLAEGAVADGLYREAIERLGRTRLRAELTRAHLLYGEWLRREGRRVDAREQLRAAHEMFTAMGADGFAERARRELLATGETVRKRTVETRDALTAQEAHIARLAVDGCTNPEIGAQLFISARTVEWHLRKVYSKLGITSRRGLGAALRDLDDAAIPA